MKDHSVEEELIESILEDIEIVNANESFPEEEIVIASEMVQVPDLEQYLEISDETEIETEDNHKTSVDFDSIVVYDPIKEGWKYHLTRLFMTLKRNLVGLLKRKTHTIPRSMISYIGLIILIMMM